MKRQFHTIDEECPDSGLIARAAARAFAGLLTSRFVRDRNLQRGDLKRTTSLTQGAQEFHARSGSVP